ncbi:MAG: DMT family transporter [Bilophila sp.]
MHTRFPLLVGYGLALAATIVWSGNFVVARGLAEALGPIELSFWRWLVAFLTLAPFAGRSAWRNRSVVVRHWPFMLLLSLMGISLFNTLIYQAGHTTDATNMALLAAASPIVMALLGRVFLHEKLNYRQMVGLVVAVCGVVVLVTRGSLERLLDLHFATGDFWMMGAVVLFAVYSLLVRYRPKELPQTDFLLVLIAVGLLGLFPPMLWEVWLSPPQMPAFTTVVGILYIGIGASVFSFLCWNMAIERIGIVRAGIVYYSVPLFASMGAAVFLGEVLHVPQIIGGVLIISGILYASLGVFLNKK